MGVNQMRYEISLDLVFCCQSEYNKVQHISFSFVLTDCGKEQNEGKSCLILFGQNAKPNKMRCKYELFLLTFVQTKKNNNKQHKIVTALYYPLP